MWFTGRPRSIPNRSALKASYWYRIDVEPGETVTLKLRLRPKGKPRRRSDKLLGSGFDSVVSARRAEADEFYDELTGPTCTEDEALVMRQAFAGLLWSKQFYFYDVAQDWLEGDPAPDPAARQGRRRSQRGLAASLNPST